MTAEESVTTLIETLGRLGIEHMIVGSLSTNYYGIPRATKDADVVLLLKPGELPRLLAELPKAFDFDPQARFEMVTSTVKHTLTVPSIPFEIEMFLLSTDEFDQLRFTRRRPAHVLGKPTFLPAPEDVILQKLLWFQRARRPKDKQDAGDVMSVQGSRLDWRHLENWGRRHGTWELLCELRDTMPPGMSSGAPDSP